MQQKNGKFEPREVQLHETQRIHDGAAAGVQPGEVVALADPTADKADKKGKSEKKSAAAPMGGMPAGGNNMIGFPHHS